MDDRAARVVSKGDHACAGGLGREQSGGLSSLAMGQDAPPKKGSEFRVFGIAVNSYATRRIGRLSNHNIEN